MKQLATVLCVVSLLAMAPAHAAETAANPEPVEIVETFLAAVGKGEVDKAVDALPKGALWASQQGKVDLLKGQIKTAMGLYGAYIDVEKVRESRYTPSVTRLTYVMKLEQHFLVWNVVFYKPKQRWETSAVVFVDQPSGLD